MTFICAIGPIITKATGRDWKGINWGTNSGGMNLYMTSGGRAALQDMLMLGRRLPHPLTMPEQMGDAIRINNTSESKPDKAKLIIQQGQNTLLIKWKSLILQSAISRFRIKDFDICKFGCIFLKKFLETFHIDFALFKS